MIAWLWARTVKSPNPAFADVDVPLASTFMLSTKRGKEAYVEPVIEGRGVQVCGEGGETGGCGGGQGGDQAGTGSQLPLRDVGVTDCRGFTSRRRVRPDGWDRG